MPCAECMWVFVGNLETWKELACFVTAYLRKVRVDGDISVVEIHYCFFTSLLHLDLYLQLSDCWLSFKIVLMLGHLPENVKSLRCTKPCLVFSGRIYVT